MCTKRTSGENVEEWTEIVEFPAYSVSTEGRVINNETGRILSISSSRKSRGTAYVSLYYKNALKVRGLALLVAEAWVPRDSMAFDTPINLNGNRKDCRAENLMWRPLWFARKYHKQFSERVNWTNTFLNLDTGQVDNLYEIVTKNGLLAEEVRDSGLVNTAKNKPYFQVWPTKQKFLYVP